LNLRPPGYEPGELPDCSTPRRGPDCSTLVTIDPMWDWAIWGALIFAALTGTAALTLLARRALRAWRDVKDARRDVARRLDDLSAKVEAAAEKVSTTGDGAELRQSVGRLRVSLAQLNVLRAALDDAHDETVGRLTAYLPGK
jgi:hypothetical protein